VDLEQVPLQSGTAILDIVDGKILKLTGDMDNEIGKQQCEKLFRVVLVRTNSPFHDDIYLGLW
jgi:hypothetical protein